jgi:hypothetical protein
MREWVLIGLLDWAPYFVAVNRGDPVINIDAGMARNMHPG